MAKGKRDAKKPAPPRQKIGIESDTEAEARARQALGMHPLKLGEELIDDSTFSELHTRGATPPTPLPFSGDGPDTQEILLEEVLTELPTRGRRARTRATDVPSSRTPSQVAALESDLQAARDRDEVAQVVLRLARCYSAAAALLVVNRGTIAGLLGDGEGIARAVDGIVIAGEARTLFTIPLKRGRPLRGPAPDRGNDWRLLRAMGRHDPREILIVPISLRRRVVNLLYTDNGSDPLADTSVAALIELANITSRRYEQLVAAHEQPPEGP